MIIIGLNSHEINSSSAIIKNGKILFGSCKERFNRIKLYNQFPYKSISYFLSDPR
jgi:predicted NodU family carbamoyl transferase